MTVSDTSRISTTFAQLGNRSAIFPYVTAGYPTMEVSEEIVVALSQAGADGFEIGMPYSDPMADGTTVQKTSQVSLQNGTKVRDCIALVGRLRNRGVVAPLLLMGYYNPIVKYGIEQFVADATAAGADGFIVPDLTVEESDRFWNACKAHGRDMVLMVAPTSTDDVLQSVAERVSGFVYCVSVKGVTGARDSFSASLPDYLDRVGEFIKVPRLVGFGISKPDHVRDVADHAEGVIVASALINYLDEFAVEEQPVRAVGYLKYLRGEGSLDV